MQSKDGQNGYLFLRDDNIKNGHLLKNKTAVPIVDEDFSVTYYAICLKRRSHILERFMNSRLQNQV
ncbi:hypothetical protein [Ligilactobacillus ruminis]|uniref:Uncharacterized protein n=1 Tax=Ligilactobacillus ruminis (strain ATCC 27782 / RF3) TaxID=1069534 RepID=G2SM81_LIGR2|nr:hypothetical protein [Ligilactobacillus ruminis]AEN77853.1 Hypothetical protein LRC_05550 [Ligilactobacillus ruminis ATCC 27782]MCR5749070.1 hypothetical protein [Lactobacillus sp.]